MDYVLTVIAAAQDKIMLPEIAMALQQRADLGRGVIDWLSDEAFDLPFAESLPMDVAGMLEGQPVDYAVQRMENRRKRLFLADLESTIIQEEMLDRLAERKGIGEKVAEITARAMRGEMDFGEALATRLAMFKNMPENELNDIAGEMTLMPGAKTLLATLKAHGVKTALVSSGLTHFTGRIGAQLGFDHHVGNALEITDGRVTGNLAASLKDGAAKRATLHELAGQYGLVPEDALAVGDGANDILMLQAAGTGVAYHAKPKTRAAADISIDHADLTALLYIQGYRKEDFA